MVIGSPKVTNRPNVFSENSVPYFVTLIIGPNFPSVFSTARGPVTKVLAFGATERYRMNGPNGKIGHAELKIGDSIIMLTDEFPEMKCLSPQSIGGSPVSMFLYVEDVDTIFNKAVSAGSRVLDPVKDQFWGDRHGRLEDPFGRLDFSSRA